VTRVRRSLHLTHALRPAVFGAQTHGLASRFLEEIPPELLDRVQAPALHSWAGASAGGATNGGSSFRGRPSGGWGQSEQGVRARDTREQAAATRFRMGEDVVHAAFGEGVVTGVEPGGVIVVRFANDGSERKLMAEYAQVARR
jgi:DNA helicase II / ATP-dependent DNA helicase PcrA